MYTRLAAHSEQVSLGHLTLAIAVFQQLKTDSVAN